MEEINEKIKSDKALIFDFDGTLADTLGFTVNSAIEINRKLNLRHNEKVNFEKFRTMDSEEFFKSLKISNFDLLFFLFKYQRKLTKEINNTKTFDGLSGVLKELHNRGVVMGIATSNSKVNVRKFLRNNDLEYFDFIYSSLNYFNKSKIIEKAVKKSRRSKDNAIYVGDEVRDIKAAKKAGVKVASVTWGYNLEPVLSSFGPDYIISRPEDLIKLA
jgi:phosphoglycolate phosphatase